MHADLRGWRRMLVVTSSLHMPRTKAIFDWVFVLPEADGRTRRPIAELSYEDVPERGMDEAQIASRREKEEQALQTLMQTTVATVTDLGALHAFLFVQHGAYRAPSADADAARARERAKGSLASTY